MNLKINPTIFCFLISTACHGASEPKARAEPKLKTNQNKLSFEDYAEELANVYKSNPTNYSRIKVLRWKKIRISSGKGSDKLADRKADEGWEAKYATNKKPWLEVTVDRRPNEIVEIFVLPRCIDKAGRYDSYSEIKKVKIQPFGLLKTNLKKEKPANHQNEDPHDFQANQDNELEIGGEVRSFEGETDAFTRVLGGIDDINSGDENIYATKIRVTILAVEKKASDMICVGEVIVTATR